MAWQGWAKSVRPLITEQVAVLGQLDDRLVALGADHDHVDVLAQHAGEIGDALALAEARRRSPRNSALPPRWVMPASKLTRVRSDGFSKSMAITRPGSSGSRQPLGRTSSSDPR